jgi:hypothetical protein
VDVRKTKAGGTDNLRDVRLLLEHPEPQLTFRPPEFICKY